MSFAAVGIIVACLLIMGSFALVAVNLESMLGDLEQENSILAFVDDNLTDEEAQAIGAKLEAIPNVQSSSFISREQALEDFTAKYEDDSLFAEVPASALRNRYQIYINDIEKMSDTVNRIRATERDRRCAGTAEIAGFRSGSEHRRSGFADPDRRFAHGLPVYHFEHHTAGRVYPPGRNRDHEDVRGDERLCALAVSIRGADPRLARSGLCLSPAMGGLHPHGQGGGSLGRAVADHHDPV
jgi:hypothetical protein